MSSFGSPPFQRAVLAIGQTRGLEKARATAVRSARITHGLQRAVVPTREELPYLLNRRRLTGCAVEIGVKRAEFSELLLRHWKGCHLISVDPWRAASAEEYVDVANVSQAEHDAFHEEAVSRLRPFGERSSVWRMTGADAASRIPHHCLDLVYIDARHDEASVREDLEIWHPKVRPGGLLAGHDYVDDGAHGDSQFGVRSAVDAFCAAGRLRLRVTFADPPWFTWWTVIPER